MHHAYANACSMLLRITVALEIHECLQQRNYTICLPEQRTRRPIASQYPLKTTICTHSIHKQCAIGMFFLGLLLWQLLLKLLRIRFLNRSYPGTPPFRCRESRPYHEEPRLKTSF